VQAHNLAAGQPRALTHSDLRIGNFLWDEEERPYVVDWGAPQFCHPVLDLCVLFGMDMPTEYRISNERRLFDHYVAELKKHGCVPRDVEALYRDLPGVLFVETFGWIFAASALLPMHSPEVEAEYKNWAQRLANIVDSMADVEPFASMGFRDVLRKT
jgi:thiamine kinase-like enzyme